MDLTGLVTGGHLVWRAPRDFSNYTLFAIYERYSNQRSVDPTENAVDIIGNGSWVTDHFSAAGAGLVTNFWEETILSADSRALVSSAGGHGERP